MVRIKFICVLIVMRMWVSVKAPIVSLVSLLAALRMKRRETHTFFDAFWQAQNITRAEAYRLLARELGVPERKAHIGNMEKYDCQRVIDFCCKNQIKKEAC